jgi:hypothetical protein
VRAHVVKPLGDLELAVDGEAQRIAFFLMQAAGEAGDREGRRFGWFQLEEALGRISFAESRALIARAAGLLRTAPA